jgi:phosphate/sulfate permease
LTVLAAIVCSIVFASFAGFVIQRAVRGAIGHRTTQLTTLLLHGDWVGGGLAAGLCYFLLFKGMKNLHWVRQLNAWLVRVDEAVGMSISAAAVVLILWLTFAVMIHVLLVLYRKRTAVLLFPVLCVLGMLAMAFAFGQNDLANCAAPGLAVFTLLSAQDLDIGSQMPISGWLLVTCGLMLFVGMNTRTADRITKAEVATGSMGDHVTLWAPRWCIALAERLLQFQGKAPALTPRARITKEGVTMHYDALRGCVIMSVSACVVATASSLGLPVSTTYVAFAAVVATGMADRIFQRGDAALKLGRSIWVITSWFLSALIAAVSTFFVVQLIHQFEVIGILVCLSANLLIRRAFKKRADAQAKRTKEEAHERAHPDQYSLEQEDV